MRVLELSSMVKQWIHIERMLWPWNLQIRLESKGGRHSSLMFSTNGVLLRKLVGAGRLKMKENLAASDESEEFSGLDATHVIVVSLSWVSFISNTWLVHIVDCVCHLIGGFWVFIICDRITRIVPPSCFWATYFFCLFSVYTIRTCILLPQSPLTLRFLSCGFPGWNSWAWSECWLLIDCAQVNVLMEAHA